MTAIALARRPQFVHEASAAEWTDSEYLRIEPGTYCAYSRAAKWYRDPQFKRWTCLILFDVFAGGQETSLGTIPMWLSGGNGEKPRASRRGIYLAIWVRANGGPPPRKDRLSPSVFTRRMAKVRVGDTQKGPVPYSVVREILAWETGGKA